jgi:hypothetical protein
MLNRALAIVLAVAASATARADEFPTHTVVIVSPI